MSPTRSPLAPYRRRNGVPAPQFLPETSGDHRSDIRPLRSGYDLQNHRALARRVAFASNARPLSGAAGRQGPDSGHRPVQLSTRRRSESAPTGGTGHLRLPAGQLHDLGRCRKIGELARRAIWLQRGKRRGNPTPDLITPLAASPRWSSGNRRRTPGPACASRKIQASSVLVENYEAI